MSSTLRSFSSRALLRQRGDSSKLKLASLLAPLPHMTTTSFIAARSSSRIVSSAIGLGFRRSFSTTSSLLETGSVSQQPGSKTFKELGDNAKQEAKELGHVIGGAMAGANAQVSQLGSAQSREGAMDSLKGDVDSIAGVLQKVPRDALVWGGAGLLPYAGTSLATVYLARSASQAVELNASGTEAELAMELLSSVQHLQISYGAVILSFLGAIHWGLEFAKYGGVIGNMRYVAGIAPVMVGWGSMLLLPAVGPQVALIVQWAGFFATWMMDQRATTWGWTPRWYSTYRFWLTAVVGSSILLTIAGESYFGPNAEAMSQRSEMAKLRQQPSTTPKGDSVDLGEFRAEKSNEAYVKFSKIDKEKEEKEAKERAEKEAKEDAEMMRQAEEEAGQEEREKKAKIGRAQSS